MDSEKNPIKILISTRFYLPGYKAGGPIRSLTNFVNSFGGEFDIRLIVNDRDSEDQVPYANLERHKWNKVGKAHVCYLRPGLTRFFWLAYRILRTPHDVLYLNSLFAPVFTLFPLVIHRYFIFTNSTIIIAPRGEFSPGALTIKRRRKYFFLKISRQIGLYRDVIWQATSESEKADIQGWFGTDISIFQAPNIPFFPSDDLVYNSRSSKEPMRVVFFSRIAPKKNLDYALEVLRQVNVPIEFSIYGPAEGQDYPDLCRRVAGLLPDHIQVNWKGPLLPDEVSAVLASQDLFFLPTRGENHGHVIAEALTVGTPVLIADTTPWRNLQKAGVGWDLPLDNAAAFASRIEECSRMSSGEYAVLRQRVREYARVHLDLAPIIEANRRLFMTAAGRLSTSPLIGG